MTPETVSLVPAVHEHRGRQGLYLSAKPDVLDALAEVAKARSTVASNRIEGIRSPARVAEAPGFAGGEEGVALGDGLEAFLVRLFESEGERDAVRVDRLLVEGARARR